MGDNGGKMCATTSSNSEVPSGIESRIEREWRITFLNFSDVIKIEMKLNACADISNITTSDLRLLYDSDGDFSNANVLAPSATVSYANSNGLITISIDMSGVNTTPSYTTYITFGSIDASQTPLPIELISFEANIVEEEVVLDWQTATETNNDFFTIERSQDAQSWEPIAQIKGAGNSNVRLSYNAIDKNPLKGISYYRLKQTDYDGKYEYSSTRVVQFSELSPIRIYPNPTSGSIIIEGLNADIHEVVVYNTLGQEMISKRWKPSSQSGRISLDFMNFPSGFYYVRIGEKLYKVFKQ
jgi:hypothetical protein